MKKDTLQILFTGISLILASVALFLSYQANQIARQNNTSEIRIVRDDVDVGIIFVEACQVDIPPYKYQVLFIATHPLTISNNGGRNVSITSIFFAKDKRILPSMCMLAITHNFSLEHRSGSSPQMMKSFFQLA